MNRQPDVELVLRAYLADTGDTAPDRVLMDVADRIARQPRRSWRLRGRPFMNTYAKVALAAAAAVIVAVMGYNLLPRTGPGPGGVPSPSPTASPLPTSAAEASTPAIQCEDGLTGCAGMLIGGPQRSRYLEPPLAFTTTGGFWSNVIDIPGLYKIDQVSDPTPGYPSILVWTNASIADQSTSCSSSPDPSLGRNEAAWIELVTNHPGIVASEPVEVGMNGVTALQVELDVAAAWATVCPAHQGPYVTLLTQDIGGQVAEYGVAFDQRLLLTVVDVGDRTVVILSYGPKDQGAFQAAMEPVRAIIASFQMCGPAMARPCNPGGSTGPDAS